MTKGDHFLQNFMNCELKSLMQLEDFKILAFTHKKVDLESIGKLHVEEEFLPGRLEKLKTDLNLREIMLLSTCNRVEFLFVTKAEVDRAFLSSFFSSFFFTSLERQWSVTDIDWAVNNVSVFEGPDALKHILNVASSMDSLVVGEREIITQVRNSYELCEKNLLTGDLLRLILKRTIETAKLVFTNTKIADKPVSVVSLAYRALRDLKIPADATFLFIGAGQTNQVMGSYLKKHGYKNFVVANRSRENGESFASSLNASFFMLKELSNYEGSFDVLISCTGSSETIIDKAAYTQMVKDDKTCKILIDLAVPADLDRAIENEFDIKLIEIESLKNLANENLKARVQEIDKCNVIIEQQAINFQQTLRSRTVELAMQTVPEKIKEIKENALNSVFAADLNKMDEESRETLNKVIQYMEKKYVSIPMRMAKSILNGEED